MTEIVENSDLLWGADEIGRFIRRPPEAVQEMLRNGHIPGKKIGKLWLSRKTELEGALASNWRRERETA